MPHPLLVVLCRYTVYPTDLSNLYVCMSIYILGQNLELQCYTTLPILTLSGFKKKKLMSFSACQFKVFFFLINNYVLLQGAQALLFNMEDMAPSVCFNSPFCTLKQISCKVSICIYHSNCHLIFFFLCFKSFGVRIT